MRRDGSDRLRDIVSISWGMFVGVFLYYTALVLLTVSGIELGATFVVVSYGLPAVAHVALVMVRAALAVSGLEVAPPLRHATAI